MREEEVRSYGYHDFLNDLIIITPLLSEHHTSLRTRKAGSAVLANRALCVYAF